MRRFLPLFLALGLLLAGCGTAGTGGTGIALTGVVSTGVIGTVVAATVPPVDYTPPPFPTPVPPTAIPPLPGGLSPTELKYRVLDQYPDFFFCDPDYYPVARDDELSLALARFPQIQADAEQFQAILAHNGLAGQTNFTDEQKLKIYQDYKKLNAVFFELAGDKYQFQIQVSQDQQQGFLIRGTVDATGKVTVESKQPSIVSCPICLAAGTRIDTPQGEVPVQDLRPGDLVWTLDARSERVAMPLLRVGSVAVPATHRVVHLLLSDGRQLFVSPGHPLADGRRAGDLKAGMMLDGALVLRAELVPYTGGATYDILPSGGTGFYWAGGILLASTLPR
ncbi:MAG TPA: Hint domain-containing protein [Anaerolineales bacterium]